MDGDNNKLTIELKTTGLAPTACRMSVTPQFNLA